MKWLIKLQRRKQRCSYVCYEVEMIKSTLLHSVVVVFRRVKITLMIKCC